MRHFFRRQWAWLAVACVTAGALTGCGEPSAPPVDAQGRPLDVIRVAPWGPKLIDFIDLYVGAEQGFFADEGVHVEQLSAEGAGDAVRNLVAGNADIAMADPFSAWFAIQRGADLTGVYCPYTENWMTLVVNTAKGIRTPADLRGRTIAVTSQASTSRYHVMFLLAENGLTEDDVRVAGVGRDFASVLLGETVDAASTWRSLNWAMFRRGPGAAEQGFAIWEYDAIPGPNDVYFARSDWLAENRDLTARFLRGLARAKRWVEANPDAAAQIGARHAIGADDLVRNRAVIDLRIRMQQAGPGVSEHGMGWCDVPTMQRVADRAVELGILEQSVDVDAIITNAFLEAPGAEP